jgi:hypothetical protein
MATAIQGPSTTLQQTLAKLACEDFGPAESLGKPKVSTSEPDRDLLIEEAAKFVDRVFSDEMSGVEAVEAVLWAAAMPQLSDILPAEIWWQCGEQLLQLRADASLRSDATSPLHLLLAGELGLTLAWRLGVFPSCEKIALSSLDAVAAFLQGEGESIDRALMPIRELRLIVASLVRCEKLFLIVGKRVSKKFTKRQREIAAEFATWMAALMRHDGTQVFSQAQAADCREDYALSKSSKSKTTKRKSSSRSATKITQPDLYGLMDAACEFDRETLAPAMAAALGQGHSGGRLAWEVSLPEAMWHSETASAMVMLPEWDVRRGRTFLDYSGEDFHVEVMGGRRSLLRGTHQTMIQVDGVTQQPSGPWECTCEYSDDDVHLIELEQPHSGGVVLQRQWMLVRDDCCLMVSDAVLPANKSDRESVSEKRPEIRCVSRLPLAPGVDVIEDAETRELLLSDGKKPRAMLMPLAANEWKLGPSTCQVFLSEDEHLVVTTIGSGAIYSPIWLDFQTHRFNRKRTWRQLTVAQDLAIVPRHVASAFRVQVGSEHWVLYRSMLSRGPLSMMGKHLIADFFAARFHPSDGGMEDLVTVDECE